MSKVDASIEDRQLLPTALLELPEFKELPKEQRVAFEAHVQYIRQACNEIRESRPSSDVDITRFFDEIELLLYVSAGSPSPKGVSAYIVHSSWTFESTKEGLRRAVGRKILDAVSAPVPSVDADVREVSRWIEGQNEALSQALKGLERSDSINGSVGHLVAIDSLVTNMLCGVVRYRLNCGN